MNATRFLLAGLLLASGSFAAAQSPGKTPHEAFLAGERRIAFAMNQKPWREVVEWLVDQTGLIFVSTQPPPTGTFNFIGPKGKTYSLPEVIDVLNEALLPHQYALVRRERSFAIVAADRQLDSSNVARVPVGELKNRGTTEIVQIVVTLRTLEAVEFAPDAKRQLGPLGSVMPLQSSNQIILQDTAGSLLRIVETIQGIEKAQDNLAEHSHKCVYVKASTAEAILKDVLGAGMPALKADDRSNWLFFSGRPSKIAQAKSLLAKIDQPQFDKQPPLLVGAAEFVNYDVPGGNAEHLVKILSDTPAFRPAAYFRMYAVSPTRILVYGGPEEQSQIAKELSAPTAPQSVTERVPLTLLDAGRVAESVKAIVADAKGNAPYIEADASRNAILVHGSKEQVRNVKSIIAAMGDDPASLTHMRYYQLERGSSVTLAEAIQRLLPDIVSGVDVRITGPGNLNPPADSGNRSDAKRPMP